MADATAPPGAGFRHQPSLDGLRGIAVLMVLCAHMDVPWMAGGFLGVDVFFALSGFLITTLLLEEWETEGTVSLSKFYLRRALRLVPALFLLIAALWFHDLVVLRGKGASITLPQTFAAAFYYSNWICAFTVFPMGVLSHTWSLAIEEQFYILWPVALLLLLRGGISRGTIAIGTCAGILLAATLRVWLHAQGASDARLYYAFDTRADCLLAGCLAALLPTMGEYGKSVKAALSRPFVAPLAGLLISAFVVRERYDDKMILNLGGYTVIALAAAAGILSLLGSGASPWSRLVSWRPLCALGRVSYGFYLWHFPMSRFGMQSLGIPPAMDVPVRVLLSLTATILSYFFVERMALRLKARLRSPGATVRVGA